MSLSSPSMTLSAKGASSNSNADAGILQLLNRYAKMVILVFISLGRYYATKEVAIYVVSMDSLQILENSCRITHKLL